VARKPRPELLELSVTGLGPNERWLARVRVPLDEEWAAEAEVIDQNGQPVIASLAFVPIDKVPLGGLTARTARPPFGPIYAAARVLVRKEGVDDLTGTVARWGYVARKPLKRQPGRRRRPDVDYARVAAAYVTACARGSRKPVQEVADSMGEGRDYIRDMLAEARRRELLTSPPPGRPGGRLTAKAEALLAQ